MASSIRQRCFVSLPKLTSIISPKSTQLPQYALHRPIIPRRFMSQRSVGEKPRFSKGVKLTAALTVAATGTATLMRVYRKPEVAAEGDQVQVIRPKHEPSRSIESPTDDTGLKLTLYQYQTCPFCCKLRAYLDYRGFSYDVVEVNAVMRSQVKWSKYKKVPILVVERQGPDGYLQLNDSSVITSILESFLVNRKESIEMLKSFYPSLESENEKGKTIREYPNKFFVMYGDKKPNSTQDELKEERRWRYWTDDHLVHILSPNVYRTPSEALQAFRYFSEVGEWEKHFNVFERNLVIYVGAVAMYIIGKRLCKKYKLKEDVRESMYDACNEWTKAIGKSRPYMGGSEPNLSDLSVYGVLSSIEGCETFKDILRHTNIDDWYKLMKKSVNSHNGAKTMDGFKMD